MKEQVVKPRPLTPAFFAERIESASKEMSAQVYKAMKAGGLLNDTGYLIENPRQGPAHPHLPEQLSDDKCLFINM